MLITDDRSKHYLVDSLRKCFSSSIYILETPKVLPPLYFFCIELCRYAEPISTKSMRTDDTMGVMIGPSVLRPSIRLFLVSVNSLHSQDSPFFRADTEKLSLSNWCSLRVQSLGLANKPISYKPVPTKHFTVFEP